MALPSNLTLEVVTAERSLVNETIDEAEVPGSDGYFGVLPGHTPFLAALKVGDLWFRQGEKLTHLSVAFGFAEVLPDRIRILAKNAELAQEIDVNRAKEAERRARARQRGLEEILGLGGGGETDGDLPVRPKRQAEHQLQLWAGGRQSCSFGPVGRLAHSQTRGSQQC